MNRHFKSTGEFSALAPASNLGTPAIRKHTVFAVALFAAVMTFITPLQSAGDKKEGKEGPVVDPEVWSPLGLPRLKTRAKPGKATPLAGSAYQVITLNVSGKNAAEGVRLIDRGTTRVLELDATREWTTPLSKGGSNSGCVSFLLYASDATVVAVDGAWVGVAASPLAGGLQLMIGEVVGGALKWREAGIHFPRQRYGGASMVALPVLTIRLDSKAGVWDLYSGSLPVADNIALAKTTGSDSSHGNFLVRAGKDRAWLCGLVQSGENPLFEDANGNGIDDEFEHAKKGGLLSPDLAAPQRTAVAKEWRDAARTQPYEAWLIDRPRPD